MKNKKKMLVAAGCTALAVILLICVILWRGGGNKPVDPTDGTTQGTAGSSGDETTESTALESGLGESTFPEDTQIPTDTWPDDITPPNNEPTQPSTEVTDPSTEPSGEPTEPSAEPTQPSEPAIDPTEPATQPTEPPTAPTEPSEPVTEPTEPPTQPKPTEPAVTWEEVNETVYAKETVNIRKGPGTEYDKLGQLKKGESVKRTAIGSNGWSRVEFDGKEAYISNNYLTTEKPEPKPTEPPTAPSEPSEGVDDIEYITMYAQVETICRSGPGDDYDNMGTLRKGAAIAVVPDSDNKGWTKMMNGGYHYYVKTEHIGPNRPNEETEPTVDPDDPWSRYVQDADPETGISWDGVSPIIYTYEDGTTGTERRHNAKYEKFPGRYAIWTDPDQLHGADGTNPCEDCGKPKGDGLNGTCGRYMKDVTCPNCGDEIKAYTCHYCDED